MKRKIIGVITLSAMSAMVAAGASEFDGGYVGAKIGSNRSDISGPTPAGGKSTSTYGLEGGYNWDKNRYLLGVEGFVDSNSKTTHSTAAPTGNNYGSDAYGVDFKLGLPSGSWMPYGRLGYAHTKGTGSAIASAISGGDLHGGLGIEYKYTPNWGVNAEWTASAAKTNGYKLSNDNFTVGLKYYFRTPQAAPVVPAAPEHVVVHEEPKAAPPVEAAPPSPPQEEWKIIMNEKPVRIEGASFDFDSAKLRPTADAKLQQVVDFANKYPHANMEVEGYTDNIGTEAYNQKLSERRAASVKAYLVKKGIAADRINATGFGEAKPVASNKTRDGRAQNRRVEVRYTIRTEERVRVQ